MTDFHDLKRPAPMLFWIMAVIHLCDTAAICERVKSRRGQRLGCFGCRTVIEPGEKYLGIASDLKIGIGLHSECCGGLIAKAKALDTGNGIKATERALVERGIAVRWARAAAQRGGGE